jgi:hypothetical protein
MATVFDKTGNALAGHSSGGRESGILTRFNRLTIPVGAVTGDVYQIFDLDKGERVLAIAMKVVSAMDQTTPLIKIGLQGGTEAGFLADSSIFTGTAGTTYIGVGAYLTGLNASADPLVAFAAADTIDAELTVTGTSTVVTILEFELVTVRTTLA